MKSAWLAKYSRRTAACFILSLLGRSSVRAKDKYDVPDLRPDEWKSVSDYPGADSSGQSPSNRAFEACMAATRKVFVPSGVFRIDGNGLTCLANTEFSGSGANSIIEFADADTRQLFHVDSGSPQIQNNVKRLVFRALVLRGRVGDLGFSEHRHLVRLSGVTDVEFENVVFEGFRGDGIYLGSGDEPGVERHNRDVRVVKCKFDGPNNNNRNAISVIDCDGLIVDGCDFNRCSRSDMPGAIDFEPNRFEWHIVRNIKVRRNRFYANGGTGGSITFYFPNVKYAVQPEGFLIQDNSMNDCMSRGGAVVLHHAGPFNFSNAPRGFVVKNNTITRSTFGFKLIGIQSVRIEGNSISDAQSGSVVGGADDKGGVKDVAIVGNSFRRAFLGDEDVVSEVAIGNVEDLNFSGNQFAWGRVSESVAGSLFEFLNDRVKRVEITNNNYDGGAASRARAIRVHRGHERVLSEIEARGNNWGPLRSDI